MGSAVQPMKGMSWVRLPPTFIFSVFFPGKETAKEIITRAYLRACALEIVNGCGSLLLSTTVVRVEGKATELNRHTTRMKIRESVVS